MHELGAELDGKGREWIAHGMNPAADSRPPLQNEDGATPLYERAGGSEAGGPGTDDNDVGRCTSHAGRGGSGCVPGEKEDEG